MKKLIEALRLKYEANLSNERIAAACGMSKGAVHKYLALAKARNISWPLADDMDEGKLEALLFPAKSPPCLLYTSPSPRDLSTSRMPSSA